MKLKTILTFLDRSNNKTTTINTTNNNDFLGIFSPPIKKATGSV
ncbi:hypothetical protein HMPREF3221_00821 [Fusobacterium nucleatum]|uniref:Uncharacterized protein n=1 Tax=Fusobacterium nucleatum TaxID=851 RepID=A0A133P3S8_FUSNU|nr:hypothetical protein HMPREF3221_00821 [Fusobacterium nucleatum]